ncbi:DUF1343 domain-containing protein [Runella sp. SP2]|uniref:exo-beta-N-acetylmuramidase NamZ domain-containing protein n=1 Tax=Runella sp. SP2 TaxID=2268026 RepID=UPI000F089D26|nr:DUF1343 domain-containing protein [Runella sp. SP2]AYQ34644.1 DUF1343 domain-containing protein [Runella sp. SP2]
MTSPRSLRALIDTLKTNHQNVGLLCNQTAFLFEEKMYLMDWLAKEKVLKTIFVPEHGLFSELQDQEALENAEIYHFWEDVSCVSLYGHDELSLKVSPEKVEELDDILIDIQDVGCRYFTYLTTIAYLFETLTRCQRPPRVWVIDHPNPAGRQVEGSPISATYASFIGHEGLLHRHGLTLGEIALWLKGFYGGTFDLQVLMGASPDYFMQIYPSPNFPSLQTAKLYSGQCLFEATILSEGRGTTRPFEIVGAPFLRWETLHRIKHDVEHLSKEYGWFNYVLRPLQFIPTFHKYANELCGGFQIHLSTQAKNHSLLSSLLLLRVFNEYVPNLWRAGAYEKGNPRTASEILVGDELLIDFVQGKQPLLEVVSCLKGSESQWINSVRHLSKEPLFSLL